MRGDVVNVLLGDDRLGADAGRGVTDGDDVTRVRPIASGRVDPADRGDLAGGSEKGGVGVPSAGIEPARAV
jgi:hypothetical protein